MSEWRTGRKNGRTIYLQLGDEPSDADQQIGSMDTAELAAQVVAAVNVERSYSSAREIAWAIASYLAEWDWRGTEHERLASLGETLTERLAASEPRGESDAD